MHQHLHAAFADARAEGSVNQRDDEMLTVCDPAQNQIKRAVLVRLLKRAPAGTQWTDAMSRSRLARPSGNDRTRRLTGRETEKRSHKLVGDEKLAARGPVDWLAAQGGKHTLTMRQCHIANGHFLLVFAKISQHRPVQMPIRSEIGFRVDGPRFACRRGHASAGFFDNQPAAATSQGER